MFLDFSVPRNPLRSLPPSEGGAWQVHGGGACPQSSHPLQLCRLGWRCRGAGGCSGSGLRRPELGRACAQGSPPGKERGGRSGASTQGCIAPATRGEGARAAGRSDGWEAPALPCVCGSSGRDAPAFPEEPRVICCHRTLGTLGRSSPPRAGGPRRARAAAVQAAMPSAALAGTLAQTSRPQAPLSRGEKRTRLAMLLGAGGPGSADGPGWCGPGGLLHPLGAC